MGVQNLWKALEKGGAVEKLEGSQAGQHERIVDAVEGKVVAVDLSAWLMQAQSAPALLEHFDSPYARAVKVVFDRVSEAAQHAARTHQASTKQRHPPDSAVHQLLAFNTISLFVPQ